MIGHFPRLLLSTAIALGLGSALSAAEPPRTLRPVQLITQVPATPPVTPVPIVAPPPITSGYAPAHISTLPIHELDNLNAAHSAGPKKPCREWLQKCGLGCWSSINSIGCGSLRSECDFIFGSCRKFYGEPCVDAPPNSGKHATKGCNCR